MLVIDKGNCWAKTVLVQAAHAAGHTQSSLGEQYRRIIARRGAKRAAVAVGHSILPSAPVSLSAIIRFDLSALFRTPKRLTRHHFPVN